MMKNLFIGMFAAITLSMSCKDVLEEKPKSLAVEVFYNTTAEAEAGVNAIYSPLRTVAPEYTATLECMSDLSYGRGTWEPLSLYQGFNDANITRVIPFWNGFYTAIRNANLIIKNVPLGTSISKADVDKYLGESKFLRALSYFQLVRNWGAVPLRTEANMTQRDLAKSSTAEIYDFIVADLIAAEATLPDNPAAAGRPSKWAAKTLLADVYLQIGKFSDAAAKSNEVIQSNKYALVRVNSIADVQNNIYGPTLLTSTEEVFYFKYSRLANEGNYFLFIVNHPSTGLYNITGAYAVYSDKTNPIYGNWNTNDLRKSLFSNVNFGLGANTLLTAKFSDKAAISNRGAGNDHPLYRYADVLLIYAEAASRAENTVSAAALEALNKVRRRAYKFDPAVPSGADYTSADYATTPFIDLVMKERLYEFSFEGKRWLELKRTGRAQEFISAAKNKTIATKHLLWPIPVGELNYNEALDPAKDQNPGY